MSRYRILVVDDELLIRDLLYDFFVSQDWDITVAEDGQRALNCLSNEAFDVVLTDLKMPGLDGMELIGRIREDYADLPVVIMTGYPSLDSAMEALRKKVADYIIKPFNINQLFKAVRKAVDERKQETPSSGNEVRSGA